jgi:hypothetical protein
MSLSPIALEALKAAQSAFSPVEADVFEDSLARGLEAVDREGRLVGAFQAQELKRLEARVADLEEALSVATGALRENRAVFAELEAPARVREVPDGEFYAYVHHDHRLGHDLPEMGGP